MLRQKPTEQQVVDKLAGFKDNLRSALLDDSYALPLWIFEKRFDFNQLAYIDKPKNQVSLNSKSIWSLARLLQIVETICELIRKDQVITKRNLYYKLVKYYQNKYSLIDADIDTLCLNLQLCRSDLRIFSSSRCLVFGDVLLQPQSIKSTYEVISNVPIAGKGLKVQTNCKVLVIVEKESALYQIHQQLTRWAFQGNQVCDRLRRETIFISSKGYPDSTSRTLIDHLLPLVDIIYFLGDSDVYGLDILLCYSIPYRQWGSLLPKINWLQLELLLGAQQIEPYLLPQSKEDKAKCIQILQRPYFKEIDHFIPYDDEARAFKTKLSRWKQKVKSIQCSPSKIELECLFKELPEGWLASALAPSCCI